MLSRSKYRIDENEIKFIDDSCYHGGSAEVVPANLVNNRTFAGVKLAVKKFRIADDERSYDRAIMVGTMNFWIRRLPDCLAAARERASVSKQA